MKARQLHNLLAPLVALTLASLLTACAETPRRSAVVDSLNSVSFAPPAARPGEGRNPADGAVRPQADSGPGLSGAEVYGGAVRRPVAAAPRQAQASEDGVTLNFDRADIREAAKVILGDVLHKNFTVDPQVNGEVTLSSSAPIAPDDLLGVFETMLRGNGATLADVGDNTFQILPLENAPARAEVAPIGGRAPQLRPGYGITVVPLRNISASSAAQFIQPLVTAPEDIRIDASRNLLLFAGSQAQRQSVVNTLADLDVNWLADRAVGLFPLRVTTAEAVIPELQQIFGSLDPTTQEPSLVRFVPVARLNAVLAVGTNPSQIEEVERWVARLDRGRTVGTQFYVYNLKHAAAEDVAKLLNEAYSDGPGSTGDSGFGPVPAGPAALAPTAQGGAPGQTGSAPDEGSGDAGQGATADNGATAFGGGAAPGATAGGGGGGGGRNPLGIKVVANRANNSLLIRATPQVYETMEATLARIDTSPLQVLIEATIVEVVLNDALRYGVQYFIKENGLRFGFNSGTDRAGDFGLTPLSTIPGFNFIFSSGESNVTIDALARLTDVKVLSSPSVVVQDNREASLTVGDEVPITTRQAVGVQQVDSPVVNSIEYRNTGVILQVRPRINENGVVSLDLAQEVSRVATSATNAEDTLTPTITQRKITSRVNVQSGQTVVLGGLIQDSETRGRDRIPIVGEIPVIGGLFGTTTNSNARTELVVFITPRVIRDAEDARDVSEELRARLKSLRPMAPEAALPPVPQPDRPIPVQPAPVPDAGPRPVVPPGTLGQAAPAAAVPADLARAARAQGVPEAWLPELVGTAPPVRRPAPEPAEEEPQPPAGDPDVQAALAPVPAEAPPRNPAALVPQVNPHPGFDLTRAPVPRVRPVSYVPEPPRPRPAGAGN